MVRDIQRLTTRKVETAKPGRYADGEGLYLVVDATGGRRWSFLFRWDGKLKEMGLGGVKARGGKPAVSLAMARERAALARKMVGDGRNPIIEGLPVDKAIPTFGEAADSLVESLGPQWRNAAAAPRPMDNDPDALCRSGLLAPGGPDRHRGGSQSAQAGMAVEA